MLFAIRDTPHIYFGIQTKVSEGMWCVNGNLSILYFRISILTKEYKNYNVQPLDFFFLGQYASAFVLRLLLPMSTILIYIVLIMVMIMNMIC